MTGISRVLLMAAASTLLFAEEINRSWQTGKVLPAEHSAYFAAAKGSASKAFVIEGETEAYLLKRSQPPGLTVNGPVRYSIEKNKIFVIDGSGDVHKMEIVKRAARP